MVALIHSVCTAVRCRSIRAGCKKICHEVYACLPASDIRKLLPRISCRCADANPPAILRVHASYGSPGLRLIRHTHRNLLANTALTSSTYLHADSLLHFVRRANTVLRCEFGPHIGPITVRRRVSGHKPSILTPIPPLHILQNQKEAAKHAP